MGVVCVGWIASDTPPVPLLRLCWGTGMGIVGVGRIATDAPLLNCCIGCIFTRNIWYVFVNGPGVCLMHCIVSVK